MLFLVHLTSVVPSSELYLDLIKIIWRSNMLLNEENLILKITSSMCKKEILNINKDQLSLINWKRLFKIARRQKVFIFIYEALEKFIPEQFTLMYNEQYNFYLSKQRILINELEEIYKIAVSYNIRAILIKGPALSSIIYEDPCRRIFSDLDILVQEEDIEKFISIMQELGYKPLVHGTNKVISKESSLFFDYLLHDIQCKKIVDNNISLCIEIKRFTWGGNLEYIKDFFSNTQLINIGSSSIYTLNLQYTFLNLCIYTYNYTELPYGVYGNKICIKNYIDLKMFIEKYKHVLDWKLLKEKAEHLKASHKLYCIFNYLNDIYENTLSVEIIDLFNIDTCTYEFDGCQNGAYFKWDSGILKRIFCDEERLIEYHKAWKDKYFTENNKNYLKSYKVQEISESSNLRIFKDTKYQKEIEYILKKDTQYLYLQINFNNFKDQDKLLIMIELKGVNSEGYLVKDVVSILKKENKYQYFDYELVNMGTHLEVNPIEIEINELICCFNVCENNMIHITIPFNKLSMDVKYTDNKLCYNIFLLEHMFEDVWATIARDSEEEFSVYVIEV